MKILHYTLGFPPVRSGGLVSYTIDLVKEQLMNGHEIFTLHPGNLDFIKKETYIKKTKCKEINSFQIVNSLPLPLFGGIKSPIEFMKPTSKDNYKNFLVKASPQIIHVHTLMGIHLEFFESAKELGIPIVFTSHDYFGLAPDPNFFFGGKAYENTNTVYDWIHASSESMSKEKLRLFQFKIYPFLRTLSKYIRRYNKRPEERSKRKIGTTGNYSEYKELKSYYFKIFKHVDRFHFNSDLAKDVYKKNLNTQLNYEVITITNSQIKKREIIRKKSRKIRVAYIGPNKDYKGFYDFERLTVLMKSEPNFEFHTYGYYPISDIENVFQHGRYQSNQLEYIYSNIDILIVPSKWKETFGLIVLEALSFGVDVFSSKNVGANELLEKDKKFDNIDELKEKIINYKLKKCECIKIKDMKTHEKEMDSFYRKVVK